MRDWLKWTTPAAVAEQRRADEAAGLARPAEVAPEPREAAVQPEAPRPAPARPAAVPAAPVEQGSLL